MASRSKLFIAIGLLVVVAAGAAYFLFLRPKGAAETTVATAPEETPGATAPAPAAPPAQPAPETGAPAAPKAGTTEPSNADPFRQFPVKWVKRPPPPPLWFLLGMPVTPHIAYGPTGFVQRFPTPTRRVAGLLWDSRVWAIYESRGQTTVVKPGDIVEGGTVQAITDDGILLQVPGETKLVLVPLVRGAPPAALAPAPVGYRPGLAPGVPAVPGVAPAAPYYGPPAGPAPGGGPPLMRLDR